MTPENMPRLAGVFINGIPDRDGGFTAFGSRTGYAEYKNGSWNIEDRDYIDYYLDESPEAISAAIKSSKEYLELEQELEWALKACKDAAKPMKDLLKKNGELEFECQESLKVVKNLDGFLNDKSKQITELKRQRDLLLKYSKELIDKLSEDNIDGIGPATYSDLEQSIAEIEGEG